MIEFDFRLLVLILNMLDEFVELILEGDIAIVVLLHLDECPYLLQPDPKIVEDDVNDLD